MRRFFLFCFVLLLAPCLRAEISSADRAALDQWIERQAKIRTLSADFVQTRILRALKSPVAPAGRMWFQAPGNFRWEIGTPAKSIVLRKGEVVSFIEPEKKRATLSSSNDIVQKSGGMTFPFVASPEEFDRRFEIVSLNREGDTCLAVLRPKEGPGRDFLKALKLAFSVSTGQLSTLEMSFRDGSALRNEFTKVAVNEKLPVGIFDFDLAGFKVEDAKK